MPKQHSNDGAPFRIVEEALPGRERQGKPSMMRKLPPFEQSLGAVTLRARESVIAPMRPKLRRLGITEPQWRVMRVISERGATDATDLAEISLLHSPSVTRILKELEERNLIVREHDAHDRRRSLVILSPQGRKVAKEISQHVLHVMREYAERFGPQRLERLTNELKALSAAIKGVE